jgi:hypothetical protein
MISVGKELFAGKGGRSMKKKVSIDTRLLYGLGNK